MRPYGAIGWERVKCRTSPITCDFIVNLGLELLGERERAPTSGENGARVYIHVYMVRRASVIRPLRFVAHSSPRFCLLGEN